MRSVATILILLSFAIPALGDDPVAIPDVIRYQRADLAYPAWVSARQAFDANGDLRPEYFDAASLERLRRTLAENSDGVCHTTFRQPTPLIYIRDRSFADLLTNATIIIDGNVLGSDVGFYRGLPETLVAVRIAQRLRDKQPLTRGDIIYAAIPIARVISPKGVLCTDESWQLPTMPQRGDRLVLFSLFSPNDEAQAIFDVVPGRHLLVQPAGAKELVANPLGKEVGLALPLDKVIEGCRLHP